MPAGRDVVSWSPTSTTRRSLRAMAEQTRVVATTVGPYMEFGANVVAACAETGTDYVDLTGEPEFVDRMWLAHHDRPSLPGPRSCTLAGSTRFRMISARCSPSASFPDDVPITLSGFVRASGTFSGGTYHSAIRAFSRVRQSSAVSAERRKAEAGARASGGECARCHSDRSSLLTAGAGDSLFRPSTRSWCGVRLGRCRTTVLTSATATTR